MLLFTFLACVHVREPGAEMQKTQEATRTKRNSEEFQMENPWM
jgi:hypothetical protein